MLLGDTSESCLTRLEGILNHFGIIENKLM